MNSSADASRGIPTRLVEMTTALALFCIGALVVFDSLRLGAGWADDGPGAGYFLFYIGSILCLCAGLLFIDVRAGRFSASKLSPRIECCGVMRVLVPSVAYLIVIELIGFYVASAIYVAVNRRGPGHCGTAVSVGIGIAVMGAIFLLFEVGFEVPLYPGIWNPLAFLGY